MTLSVWTTFASVGFHALLAAVIVFVLPDPRDSMARSMRVPIEMRKAPTRVKPPPPPPPKPVPVPPAMRPRKAPRPKPKAITMPPPKAPAPTPPPATKPPEPSAPPVFGVTMESVVEGDSSVSAPIGNTLQIEPPKEPGNPGPVPAANPRRDPPDIVPPRVRRQVQAPYPRAALEAGIEGKVLLLLTIDAKGRVTRVRVLKGPGHGLNEAAVEAAKQFTFSPGTVDGRAGPMEIRYTYTFVIDE